MLSPKNVLLLEDDSDIAELITEGLQACGFNTISVPSIADALHALEQTIPDFIILDNYVPDGRGSQLSKLSIPTIIYTGGLGDIDTTATILYKPTPIYELIFALKVSEQKIKSAA